MNTQNILKFYGSKLDVKLDYSEFYDFELTKTDTDFDTDLIDLTTEITYSSLELESDCITGTALNSIKPWIIPISEVYSGYSCNSTIRRRTEEGWTLDFVFNKEGSPWSSGYTFYYWGLSGGTNQKDFADNNLSFSFTDDGRIKWESYRYSGICNSVSGYSEVYYTSTGQTPVLCTGGTSEDFNISIVYKRNYRLENCDLENDGGWNDLINSPYTISYTADTGTTTTQIVTGYTITNYYQDYLTGATVTYEDIEILNKKWFDERNYRLGTLKIYLNGKRVYKLDDWEEIIPSLRSTSGETVQMWGGGTTGYTDIHTGVTEFNLKQIKYFEEPLNFVYLQHHYKTSIKPNFDIAECSEDCTETPIVYTDTALLTELNDILATEDDNVLIY